MGIGGKGYPGGSTAAINEKTATANSVRLAGQINANQYLHPIRRTASRIA